MPANSKTTGTAEAKGIGHTYTAADFEKI